MREDDGGDAALFPLLRHLAGAPGVVDGLDDLVLVAKLGNEGGDLEHGVIARPGCDADVQVLVEVDDGASGALAADVDADPNPLAGGELRLSCARLPGSGP
jgi:hypothetical protein